MVNIKINGIEYAVEEGTTILEACRQNGIKIPTLCWLKDINAIGACRICVVEMTGARSLVASCVYPLSKFDEGKNILTHSPAVLQSRKMTLQLLLSDHNMDCLACSRNGSCELQELCKELGVDDTTFFEGEKNEYDIDYSSKHMFRDNNKCIHCRRCIAACDKLQGIGVIGANNRGFKTSIDCAFDLDLAETACVSCGQCITACPTGALAEKDDTDKVWDALADPEKVVVVQTAPAVRASLGEAFGYPMGTPVEGKMVAALRRLGFNAVFDTNFGADLTIMEESHEFLDRVTNGGVLPMITSCSPGWIRFCEAYFPEFIPNLSSCKSPQQMNGAITKTYWAKKMGIDPKNIVSVSVMPCTAKKFEIGREDQSAAGVPDVDISITTRELVKMINRAGLRFRDLPDEVADSPLGNGTGAAVIFGATGGVMEAALRTAHYLITGREAANIDFKEVRGLKGIKEAEIDVDGTKVKVAIAHGLANVGDVLAKIKQAKAEGKEPPYHFIEVMACEGGCVAGGGQPYGVTNELRKARAKGLYDEDSSMQIRCSHANPAVQKIYKEYLGEPLGDKAHKLLHNHYKARESYKG